MFHQINKSFVGKRCLVNLFMFLLLISMLAACSSQESSENAGNKDILNNAPDQTQKPANNAPKEEPEPIEPEPQEPVTLQFYTATVIGDFEEFVNQYVKEEFPHITLEVVENKDGTRLQELIAANAIPDIIWQGLTNLGGQLADLNVPMDLEPLAKKHGFDFGVYDEKMVDSIRSYSPEGKLIYLPYNVLVFATHYNKEIFDRFGVGYPDDHMTWEEMIDLGSKLTRTDDGTSYIGLRPTLNTNRIQGQLSLGYVDPDTGKADVNNDGWKRLFNLFKNIEDLSPGDNIKSLFNAREEFLTNQTVAIMPDILQLQNTDMPALEAEGFIWDVVTYPSCEDLPGVGPKIFSDGFILANRKRKTGYRFPSDRLFKHRSEGAAGSDAKRTDYCSDRPRNFGTCI